MFYITIPFTQLYFKQWTFSFCEICYR